MPKNSLLTYSTIYYCCANMQVHYISLLHYLNGDGGGSGVAITLYRDLTGLSRVEEATGRANGFCGVGLRKKNISVNPNWN